MAPTKRTAVETSSQKAAADKTANKAADVVRQRDLATYLLKRDAAIFAALSKR